MSDKKISQLTNAARPLAGTEVFPLVQSGQTVKSTVDSVLTAGRPASFGNLAYTGTLTGSTGVLNIGSGQIYKDAIGNLGIGTTSPTSFGAGYVNAQLNGTSGCFLSLAVNGTRTGYLFSDVSGTEIGNITAGFLRAYVNGAVRLNVASGGDVTVNTGNLVIGTAGKGIDFSADPSAAGMTSELLDDYEEGTWTTTVSSVVNFTGTPTLDEARYTKVGRLVQLEGRFSGTVTTGSTLTYFIFTVPFSTSGNVSGATGTIASNSNLKIGAVLDASTGSANTMLFMFPVQAAQPSGADTFYFSISYTAA